MRYLFMGYYYPMGPPSWTAWFGTPRTSRRQIRRQVEKMDTFSFGKNHIRRLKLICSDFFQALFIEPDVGQMSLPGVACMRAL